MATLHEGNAEPAAESVYGDTFQQHYLPSTHEVGPRRPRKKFIVCFDGTGNKFQGTEADSNILKIYRMLDRSDGSQFHYYQPGIGTYIADKSLSDTGMTARFKSWYAKAKDSAVGTYFGDHVMAGYKFLMRYYTPGDDIYMFGFSRGAYTARFLAEMLDSVGLLSQGNEEMCRFAWKTFHKWQVRKDGTEEERQQKRELMTFMCAFRETFSRPIRRIRFLGLFDTVNSVPAFENAWLERNSRFPYTARSQAKVIRHAVALDERRAKFRQDLIAPQRVAQKPHQHIWHQLHAYHWRKKSKAANDSEPVGAAAAAAAPIGNADDEAGRGRRPTQGDTLFVPQRFRNQSETSGIRSLSRKRGLGTGDLAADAQSIAVSEQAYRRRSIAADSDSDDNDEPQQDILEVWFPGCHADIGGGWPLEKGEKMALSHVPLVWMVHEAQKAGLNFDEVKLRALHCCPEVEDPASSTYFTVGAGVPQIEIEAASPGVEHDNAMDGLDQTTSTLNGSRMNGTAADSNIHSRFHRTLMSACEKGQIHDVLDFNNGVSAMSVLSWRIMEYMPFRRMDLQPDGSWKSIIWPLPKGETRDIPEEALIHNSVLLRMKSNPNYRPGNLICGGGGRGVRKAPEEMGIGKWKVAQHEGDMVKEVHIRAEPPSRKNTGMK